MIRAGLIGTGGISRVHLEFLRGREDVTIAALCDVADEKAIARQRVYGGEVYSSFEKMLEEARLDAVWICTPPDVRREPLLACAERGVPVFCEKPVERSVETAESITGELAARNARVQVGYVFRTMPVVQRLRSEIQSDTIHMLQSTYICNVSLTGALRSWFYEKEVSGGALVDQATHNLDLMRYLLGEVSGIQGVARNRHKQKQKGYTIDELIALSFSFEDGMVGSHVHSWIGDGWHNRMLFSGEKALYRLDLGRGRLTIERGGEVTVIEQGGTSIHHYENAVFLDQVKSGDWSGNPSTYEDGVKSLALTLDCDSALNGS